MNCVILTCPKCGGKYCSCDTCECQMVDSIIRGDFGNGQERKEKLGDDYNHYQNLVNERLGYPKRYPE